MNLFQHLERDLDTVVHRYEHTDPRLGRHVRHDPRNARYPVGVLPASAIQSVHWDRAEAILDQGQLGSCTGNAGTGWLGTANAAGAGLTSVVIGSAGAKASHGHFKAQTYTLDEAFAVQLYGLATDIDPYSGQYPPTDTGSDGPSIGAALKLLGLSTGYAHAFSLDALKSAIQVSAVLWGTEWLNSMFDPDSSGTLTVDPASGVAGGHELVISGFDVNAGRWIVDNSWGTGWGLLGSCFVSDSDMAYLLSQQGDITVPVVAAPAPPVPPVPPVPSTTTAQQLWDAQKVVALGLGVAV
jgi:hypothetical protein